jgi:viroplasmin and RNaseH domain-containing protein
MSLYVVYKGRVSGVYEDWEDYRRHVYHFSGNNCKGYNTMAETKGRYARYLAVERREMRRNRMKTTFIMMMFIVAVSLFLCDLVYVSR